MFRNYFSFIRKIHAIRDDKSVILIEFPFIIEKS